MLEYDTKTNKKFTERGRCIFVFVQFIDNPLLPRLCNVIARTCWIPIPLLQKYEIALK